MPKVKVCNTEECENCVDGACSLPEIKINGQFGCYSYEEKDCDTEECKNYRKGKCSLSEIEIDKGYECDSYEIEDIDN